MNTANKITLLHKKISLILFGLFLTLVILEIGLRIGGFAILSIQEYRNLQSIKQKGSFRIMCLGESTTQGQYPPYLEEILNQRNIGIKFSVIDKGLGGTTTAAILSELEANLDKYQPDMVITMMGINDSGSHIPHEVNAHSKTMAILKSSKIYKLIKFLWLRMVIKFKEKESPKSTNQIAKKLSDYIPKDNAGEAYKELDYFQQEQVLIETIKQDKNNVFAYKRLGYLYRTQRKFSELEQILKEASKLYPNNDSIYRELGKLYRDWEEFERAEQTFKKVLELNPSIDVVYEELGMIYRDHGKFEEAEKLFKKALKFDLESDRLNGRLATLYYEINNLELADVYTEKAKKLRERYYNPMTITNYRELKEIIERKNIKLMCVQYPMRTIRLLKKIFEEDIEDSTIFVDNEKIFKDAIREKGYNKYFIDMFGGDFGHCTQKGNRLLAENIANVILKEYFNK